MQRASRDANVYMFQNTKVRSKNIDGRMDYVIYVRWRHTRTMDEKGGNGEQFQNEKKKLSLKIRDEICNKFLLPLLTRKDPTRTS